MNVSRKIRNVARRFLQGWAPSSTKRQLWNAEFASVQWDCLESGPDDCVYRYIERYADRGSILDLGCGAGNTSQELKESAYSDYTGVDVSDVAIGKAAARSRECGRSRMNTYEQGDILSYAPRRLYNLILFRESLFYVPTMRVRGVLERYSQFLAKNGVIVVRMWSSLRYPTIVRIIKSYFDVVEQYSPPDNPTIVLVFRPRLSASVCPAIVPSVPSAPSLPVLRGAAVDGVSRLSVGPERKLVVD